MQENSARTACGKIRTSGSGNGKGFGQQDGQRQESQHRQRVGSCGESGHPGGVRHIRIPTTVLSQNDSGVGVKNGVNYHGKKNFLGTFAPPAAVFNDAHFLSTLDERDWRSGMIEAVKVALIKDAAFFEWMEQHAEELAVGEPAALQYLIRRCAELHIQHIGGAGDPFESGSSRPLDFGHWSAHKLEQLTDFELRHGEAVSIGIALDSVYALLTGMLDNDSLERIIRLLKQLRLPLYHPLLDTDEDGSSPIMAGLEEFREHLGGRLTIALLEGIGKGKEVHAIDPATLHKAAEMLREPATQSRWPGSQSRSSEQNHPV